MSTKAARTKAYIIDTVAPIFNRQGYVGTSLSDLTEATGLTKGAIYGNFENKDQIALAAYHKNSSRLLDALDQIFSSQGTAAEHLIQIIGFYKTYDEFTREIGGCPLVNTGIDAQYNHRGLEMAVRETIRIIEERIATVLEKGITTKTIRLSVAPIIFARQFFTIIQGAVAQASLMQDRKYLTNTMNYLEVLLRKELMH
ncbi:MAG: hypothetical protein RLZZ241_2409 [Bacteroidota bacterium]